MKKLLLLFVLTTFYSCSDEDDNNSDSRNNFAGYYKITSIVSETAVDLNNDGLASYNLLSEYESAHHVGDGVFEGFYDADQPYNFADVRDNGLISFNYPFQDIQYFNNLPEHPFFAEYDAAFTIYSYELNSDSDVMVQNLNPEINDQFGEIQN